MTRDEHAERVRRLADIVAPDAADRDEDAVTVTAAALRRLADGHDPRAGLLTAVATFDARRAVTAEQRFAESVARMFVTVRSSGEVWKVAHALERARAAYRTLPA